MTASPLLNYALTTTPQPLQVNATGSLTVVASNPGFYSNDPTQNYVDVTQVVIDFGASGPGGGALTNDPGRISVSAPAGWSGPAVSGLQFTFTAPTAGNANRIFPKDGLSFTFNNVAINGTEGNVLASIGETASSPGGTPPTIYPPFPKMVRSLTLGIGKFPAQFVIHSFASSQQTVAPGAPVQLSWNTTALTNASFSLSYTVGGMVKTVAQHLDGSPLAATDTYPNPQHDGALRLPVNATTTFTLAVSYVSASEVVQTQGQVTVSVPDPTISGFSATPVSNLSVGDKVTLSWSTVAADQVTITPPLDGLDTAVAQSGSADVYPLTFTRYVLAAAGRGLNVCRSLVVFPMAPGWTTVTTQAGWSSNLSPMVFALGDFLWMYPGVPGTFDSPAFSSPDGATWILVDPATALPGRQGAAVVTGGGTALVMGGTGAAGVLNDVWSSSDGKSWTQVTGQAAWPARRDAGTVWFQNKFWILGGSDTNGTPLGDVWSSPDGATWTQATGTPGWSARSAFGVVVSGSTIYLFGGQTGPGLANDLWSSSDGIHWHNLTNPFGGGSHPSARSHTTMFHRGSHVLMIGGLDGNGNPLRDAFLLDTSSANWATTNAPPTPAGAKYFGAATFNTGSWLLGGANETYFGHGVWVFAGS